MNRIARLSIAAAASAAAIALVVATPSNLASTATLNEDAVGWNCLTMGNRVCGDAFAPIGSPLADALAEGEDSATPARDWSVCLVDAARTFIVCPDGFTKSF